MKLTIIGTGYVGLVTGACFAEMGNTVTCVDIDARKVEGLKKGILPMYEPGLETLVANNYKNGRLQFCVSLNDPVAKSGVYFIAVGTPPEEDGSADLKYVLAVARDIGQHISEYTIVVNKSTVPVGTADKVNIAIRHELINRNITVEYAVISNPEFLKEGAAVEDFMRPDRVIVGTDSNRARNVMRDLYIPFMRNHERLLFMGVRDAEMSKYAGNAMLATKISFMNEIANLCERMGVDVENVRQGIGSDTRIGYSFIYPGAGYGGSCFPKDVKALIHMAKVNQFDPKVLNAVEERNEQQKRVLFDKIQQRFGNKISGLTLGVWGLAFKPGTDDMREASSVVLLRELISAGAKIKAYDPVAMPSARRELPGEWFKNDQLKMVDEQYSALEGSDAMVLMTEWKPFRHPDFDRIKRILKHPIIFDGRNLYDPTLLRAAGFEYSGIGR
ncbi:MAG: UDP-glucose/GDP-mannose dehydrogenase family protein [Sulfuricaulis sp.]|nr:UDP-glucose/GDP-mannose dehydrogenase family protein [Sulfuricaulis sp.]